LIANLTSNVASNGTAGSIAYSQMNFLPAIQIASLAGIAGIVFAFSLFSALAAIAWHCRARGYSCTSSGPLGKQMSDRSNNR
jgi:apolipoprotein N-acyltransferase